MAFVVTANIPGNSTVWQPAVWIGFARECSAFLAARIPSSVVAYASRTPDGGTSRLHLPWPAPVPRDALVAHLDRRTREAGTLQALLALARASTWDALIRVSQIPLEGTDVEVHTRHRGPGIPPGVPVPILSVTCDGTGVFELVEGIPDTARVDAALVALCEKGHVEHPAPAQITPAHVESVPRPPEHAAPVQHHPRTEGVPPDEALETLVLRLLPPPVRDADTWFKVGCALHAAGDRHLPLFERYTARSSDFSPAKCAAKWTRMNRNRATRVSWRTLVDMAARVLGNRPELEAWCAQYHPDAPRVADPPLHVDEDLDAAMDHIDGLLRAAEEAVHGGALTSAHFRSVKMQL